MNKINARLDNKSEMTVLRERARLCPAFQPIVNLQSGEIVGFEALARFEVGTALIGPGEILPHFDANDLSALFSRMFERAIALTQTPWWPGPNAYVSVNVEACLVLREGFCDLLDHLLEKSGGAPEQLVIELLEGERVDDHERMASVMTCLQKMGIGVALDDLGSGYSSLINLQQLPVDIIKLDRSFASDLKRKPEDLLFIHMLAGLARGLGKQLIIEGVETPDIVDALTILGVNLAQGFAIARPMPADAIEGWLEHRARLAAHRTPTTLLGAYASHLMIVESCRMLQLQPLQVEWKDKARDWRTCKIGRYFSHANLHDTCCGAAHRRFHEVISCYETDRESWERAASDLRDELLKAMSAD